MQVKIQCPNCNSIVAADVDYSTLVPKTRGLVPLSSTILVYQISSDDMRKFITAKAKKYCPDASIEVVPCYCEKKKRKETDPRRSFASLRIAFSEHILEKTDNSWYGKIGESNENLRVQKSVFNNIINLYRYDPKDVANWTSSYQNMEALEETLGMSENYLKELEMYSTPRRIQTKNGESWIIFAAAAENVIKDMLTDPKTNQLQGRMEIHDVYPVSKEVVNFVVYMHPQDIVYKTNPHVKSILLGEEKGK